MRAIRCVAWSVFRESVRDRVPYNLVAFAVLLIAASYLIGQLTAGQDVKIIKDLGLAATSIFGLFIAVFIGVGLVSKEVERRSIYSLLAKPVRRHEFIAGKFAGLVLTLVANLTVMVIAYYVVLYFMDLNSTPSARSTWPAPATDPNLLKAFYLIALQLSLVTAIALFFSSFSSPFLSAALTLALYVAGQFGADLRSFTLVIDTPATRVLMSALYYVLPNFAMFDVKNEVVHAVPVTAAYVGLVTGYAVLYIGAVVLATMGIFSRRDFK